MSRVKVSRAEPSVLVPRVRGLRESVLWVLIGLSIILFLALATYDPVDPAFSVSSDAQTINNRMGPAGAWFADLAYLLLGIPAYLLPMLVLGAGIHVFKGRKESTSMLRPVLLLRTGGFLLLLVTSCGLANLHFYVPVMRETAGGVIGQLIGGSFAQLLGLLGATVLLLVLWLASVSLATSISWLAVMDVTGKFVLSSLARIQGLIGQAKILIQGRRAKQHRQSLVSKSRAKLKTEATRIEPSLTTLPSSDRLEREKQVPLFEPPVSGELPPLALLDDSPTGASGYSPDALEAMSRLVELKLADFGIEVEVVSVQPGPVVTRFELKPAPGIKASKISSLSQDLARSLSTVSVRVVEVIPGKPYVGLEIPNEVRELVSLGEIVKSEVYDKLSSPLTLALGKDIGGQPVVADLSRMPHLLIAGTTGSGKSVALNAMVLSLLYKSSPEHVRLIMIDPKMLELSVYEGIPHLLAPVVTDMKEAANALRWCVAQMERRYSLMAALGVRHISSYNRKVNEAIEKGEPIPDPTFKPEDGSQQEIPSLQALPNIVVIIDELADMMMMVGKKVEELIARLAQKARASGIHMIVATQRPSVDVITGLIKANIPCRIAFQVSAKVDSRTILDQIGAENLLGHGDMLYLPVGSSTPTRIHGAFVSDNEVHAVVNNLRASGAPAFIDEILAGPDEIIPGIDHPAPIGELDGEQDPLYDQAVRIVTESRKASISGVQRRLKIGYNRAARMVETMEEAGIVGSLQANGSREVIAPSPVSGD
ncbi:MAG: cell division protein FtsK [Rhodospirillaceae bacterium]|nr:cell division protein FtsK [Rhodospirillaceae bacterium]